MDRYAVFRVVEYRRTFRSVECDVGFHGFGGAEGEGARDGQTANGAQADHGGVVRFDIVRAVKIRLHRREVFRFPRSGDAERRGDCVGQRIGGDAINHIHAVEAAFACPAGALVIGTIPDPTARSSYPPLQVADAWQLFRGFLARQPFQCSEGAGAEALEADLDTAASLSRRFLETEEVAHRGNGGLLQIQIRLGGEHR